MEEELESLAVDDNYQNEAVEDAPIALKITEHVKLEDIDNVSSSFASEASGPPADLALQNFLDAMSNNPDNPPAAVFTFPKNAVSALQDMVQHSGLYMIVFALPQATDNWTTVVVGRNLDSIGKVLDDGEKLALALRRPEKFQLSDWNLGISHLLVGALGAIGMWAGLAYC